MSLLDALIEDSLSATQLPMPFKEVWLAIRTDAPQDPPDLGNVTVIGDGSRENPFSANTAFQFDKVMSTDITPNTLVHLGPGIFRTRGGAGDSVLDAFWKPKSGQKIIGSGMFSTTLLLTTTPTTDFAQRRFVVGVDLFSDYLENFEISDLTIDCNLQNQPVDLAYGPHTLLSTTAIAIPGRNIVARRVRIINFGTRSPSMVNGVTTPTPEKTLEGYPLRIGWRTKDQTSCNAALEDCIVEQPDTSPAREVTILTAGGVLDGDVQDALIPI